MQSAVNTDLVSNPLTLSFRNAALEGEYLAEVAKRRWPVLLFIFCFDVVCYLFRITAKCVQLMLEAEPASIMGRGCDLAREFGPQLANMAVLYIFLGLLNRRSRRLGDKAARQEEVLLSVCMAFAICNLLASLSPDNRQDYVYVAFFLICTSTFLKIRWWVGTAIQAIPTALVQLLVLAGSNGNALLGLGLGMGTGGAAAGPAGPTRLFLSGMRPQHSAVSWLGARSRDSDGVVFASGGAYGDDAAAAAAFSGHGQDAVCATAATAAGGGHFPTVSLAALLSSEAAVHVAVAWAVGGLMAYLADGYQRQMFAHSKLAALAHNSELMEAQARIAAQRALAAAQAQAAHRALSVAREKAANEAKSEFMSLMCHEVRTPLNGCLASAEMLLETPLLAEQRELAATIRVSGSILLSTVSNFLDFFKLEAGKALDIVRTCTDLRQLVADVHCIIEAMIGRGGEVTLLQPDMQGLNSYLVYCDADRVRGILLNLYTNAAKFTKQGHIQLRVREVPPGFAPEASPGYGAIVVSPSRYNKDNNEEDTTATNTNKTNTSTSGSSNSKYNNSNNSGSGKDKRNSGSGSGGCNGSGSGGNGSSKHDVVDGAVGTNATANGRCGAANRRDGQPTGSEAPAIAGAPSEREAGSLHEPGPSGTGPRPAANQGSAAAAAATAAQQPCHSGVMDSAQGHAGPRENGCGAAACGRSPSPSGANTACQHGAAAAARQRRAAATGAGAACCPCGQIVASEQGLARYDQQPSCASKSGGEAEGGQSGCASRRRQEQKQELRPRQQQQQNGCPEVGARAVGSSKPPQDAAPPASSPGVGSGPVDGQEATTTAAAVAAGAAAAEHKAPANGSYQEPVAAAEGSGRVCEGGNSGNLRWLLFEVADTGTGITPEALKTLFREYVQGTEDEMRKPRSKGGTGLGLSICSKQVGLLGGRIGAYSCPGRGSIFWFTIPLIEAQGEGPAAAPPPQYNMQPPQQPQHALPEAQLQPTVCSPFQPPGAAPVVPPAARLPAPSSDPAAGEGCSLGEKEPHAASAAVTADPWGKQPQPQGWQGLDAAAGRPFPACRKASTAGAANGDIGPPRCGPVLGHSAALGAGGGCATIGPACWGSGPPLGTAAAGGGLDCRPAQWPHSVVSESAVVSADDGLPHIMSTAAATAAAADDLTCGGADLCCLLPPVGLSAATVIGSLASASGSSCGAARLHSGQADVAASIVRDGSCGPHPYGQVPGRQSGESPGAQVPLVPAEGPAAASAGNGNGAFGPHPGGCPGAPDNPPAEGWPLCTAAGLAGAALAAAAGEAAGGTAVGYAPGRGAAALSSLPAGAGVCGSRDVLLVPRAPVVPQPPPLDGPSSRQGLSSAPPSVAGPLPFAPGGDVGLGKQAAGSSAALGHSKVGAPGGPLPLPVVPPPPDRSNHGRSLAGRRVLLVEDNLINQTVARKMLTSLGLHCEVASNGLEAVQRLERALTAAAAAAAAVASGEPPCGAVCEDGAYPACAAVAVAAAPARARDPGASSPAPAPPSAAAELLYDIVLMDMAMPVMGGVDATRAIRRLGCRVPIVAMTANALERDQEECRLAGMNGFLSKPVLKDRLAESLLQALEGSGWARPGQPVGGKEA